MKDIGSLFLALLISAGVACKSRSAELTTNVSHVEQQSSPVLDLKARWEEQSKKLDSIKLTKDYPGRRLDLLVELLKAAPASQVKSELERVRNAPGDYEQMDEYDRFLLQGLFVIYATSADRNMLVYILSAKCPRFVATSPVELEIASLKIQDPFLVLFDSYDAASDGERAFLLSLLRDSLKDLAQKYPSDSEFVKMSKAWYVENASKLEPNPYYHPAGRGEQRDLFIAKR